MQFLLWVARGLHIFSVVIWLGGLLFIGGILHPVFEYFKNLNAPLHLGLLRRFSGFVWMSAWTIGITGFFLTLFHYRLGFDGFGSPWDFFLIAKLFAFIGMTVIALSTSKLIRKIDDAIKTSPVEAMERESRILVLQRKASIILGISSVLLGVAMVVYS